LRPLRHGEGGVFHLQFANWRRLVAKHAWYKVTERLRWPERQDVSDLDAKYRLALDEAGLRLSPIPSDWTAGWKSSGVWQRIDTSDAPSWHEQEVRELIDRNGREMFRGLDLYGVA